MSIPEETIARLTLENDALRRHLRRHRQKEVEAQNLKHVGLHAERLKHNPRERAIAKVWAEECEAIPGTDHGFGLLQNLMFKGGNFTSIFNGPICMERITQRDAEIVATVIQWFGSNCGHDFIRRALEAAGYSVEPKKSLDKRAFAPASARQGGTGGEG